MSASRSSIHRMQRRPPPPPEGWPEHLLSYLLDPIDALTAAIYSILMVLTFTLAFSVIEAVSVIADEFDYVLEPIASEKKRYLLYADVLEHLRDSQPRPVTFQRDDFVQAFGTVIVAILAALPALLPLWLLRDNPPVALRTANVVSFIMLFIFGYRWGFYTGANRWKTGLLLVSFGVILMAIAIPLGG